MDSFIILGSELLLEFLIVLLRGLLLVLLELFVVK